MPRMSGVSALLGCLALALWASPVSAQRVQLPCERITGITNCIECFANTKACVLCQQETVPVWTAAGKIQQCKAATQGATCQTASGDVNCIRCDRNWCVRCRAGYAFNQDFRCVPGGCPAVSRNPACAACNPDGTCTRCRAQTPPLVLMPSNSIFLNVPLPETKCVTVAALKAQAMDITGKAPVLPTGCSEVDTVFKCNRCIDGYSLTAGKCVLIGSAAGSKCSASVRFRQYCAKCNTAGTACIQCSVPGRSIFNGACNLPCKQLFGIGCLSCTPWACTRVDLEYQNGRR